MSSVVKCKNCGKKFLKVKNWQEVCKLECQREYYKNNCKPNIIVKEKALCVYCGKKFNRKSRNHFYCSRECNINDRELKQPTAIEWQVLREYVLERDNYKCSKCGSDNQLQMHHIVPLMLGGSNETENIITLCSKCHGNIHAKINLEFEAERIRLKIP